MDSSSLRIAVVAVLLIVLIAGLAQGLRIRRGDQPLATAAPALATQNAGGRWTPAPTPTTPGGRPQPGTPPSQHALTPGTFPLPSVSRAATPMPSGTPTATPKPTNTPTTVPLYTPTATPQAPLPTPSPTAPQPGATPRRHALLELRIVPPSDLPAPHLWLARPFAPPHRQWAEQTYPYGSRGDGRYVLHTGVDIVNPMGTPVLSVAEGEVIYAGNDAQQAIGPQPNFFGNLVIVRLAQELGGQPIFVLYGHLNTISVQAGQHVFVGSVIGTVGMTGIAVGPHLHLEVRVGQNSYLASRNPEFWLRPLPQHGILAGRYLDTTGQPLPGQRLLVYKLEHLDRVWQVIYTYPADDEINSDDAWRENFLLADVPAGEYLLETAYEGGLGRLPFVVAPGQITFVEVRVSQPTRR